MSITQEYYSPIFFKKKSVDILGKEIYVGTTYLYNLKMFLMRHELYALQN